MAKVKGREHGFWPWSHLVFGFGILALGLFFAVKWLAFDEPDVYGRCSTGGESCQQGGEGLNMTMTLVIVPLGLLAAWYGVRKVRRHRERAAADRALLADGRQGDAVVTEVEEDIRNVTRTNGRITSQGYRLTLDPGDGGEPLRMEVELPPRVEVGDRFRVAYDPTTRDAVLLDAPPESVGDEQLART